jgi:surface protein
MALQLGFTVTSISQAVTNARYEIKKDGDTVVSSGVTNIPSNGVMLLPMDTVSVAAKDLVSIHLDDFNGSNSEEAKSAFGWTSIYNDDITVSSEAATVTLANPTYKTGTWDFGDGSVTSTAVDPIYDYGKSGTFTITFTSDNGDVSSLTVTLNYVLINFYDAGQGGAWYKANNITTLFQDAAGTTSVNAAGDPVGSWGDNSPNAVNATQPVSADRPTYSDTPEDNLYFDGAGDNLDIPLVDGEYHVFEQSSQGLFEYSIEVSGGLSFEAFKDNTTEVMIVNGNPNRANIRNYFNDAHVQNGFSGIDFYRLFKQTAYKSLYLNDWDTSSVTTFNSFARGCVGLTTFDANDWDTSSVTDFSIFVYDCPSLTTLSISNWDTSSVTNFSNFALGCVSLTTLDISNWDTSSVTNFYTFVRGCASLTTLVINGGTGNPFADSPCTNYGMAFYDTNLTQQSIDDILVAINTAGTSNGAFDQSGGSAPSATGNAAVDSLRSRGWAVLLTGGY